MNGMLEQVKALRAATLAPFGECKKALTKSAGDLQKAIEFLRVAGIAKMTKSAGKAMEAGAIATYKSEAGCVVASIRCQTDFVACNEKFVEFADQFTEKASLLKTDDLAVIKEDKGLQDMLAEAVLSLGENIVLSDIKWFPNTGDTEGDTIEVTKNVPSIEELKAVLTNFTGPLMQTPHKFSACKVDGNRAYNLARKGIEFRLALKPIHIHKLEYISHVGHSVSLRVECSTGTYVRTLAEDIAKSLGSLAYLSKLRRTKVGLFQNGYTLEQLGQDKIISINNYSWIAPDTQLALTNQEGHALRNGNYVHTTVEAGTYVATDTSGVVGVVQAADNIVYPKRICNLYN